VLDPFMGTGTTLVAAQLEGARGIGIEIDASYVAVAQRRLIEASQVQLTLSDLPVRPKRKLTACHPADRA
jgi:DNA modification methylase